MRTLGVELAHMLRARGVDCVFGIPGVHNIEMYRGVEEAGLRHVLARHEQGAGFMADGYARATGRPGVCFVISGPGLTNIMTPMGQAYSDSVPMLVFSTVLDETAARRGQLHQMRDQEGAGRTVADWSETARTADAAFQLVDRALAEFDLKRARPKSLHVPIRLLGAASPPFPQGARVEVQSAQGADVGRVLAEIRKSRRPLMIFGGGVKNTRADALLARAGAASFTTYAGRGVVSQDAPLHFGALLARATSRDIVEQADLVIAFGTELAQTDLWRDDLGEAGMLIRIDLDPEVLAHSQNQLAIQADADDFIRMLGEALPEMPGDRDWTPAEVAGWRARWRAEIDAERPGIAAVCDALSAALPRNTMIFSDMTQFAYAALEVWDMPAPGLWHHPSGFGTLGYALPAAIGGSLGHDGPVMAIAGDYGFQYTIQELGTAAELGLSLPILLWDNNALGEIRDNMVSAQISPVAVTLKNPEWRHMAAAYGCGYAEPATLAGLAETVNAAFTAGRPTIIRATPALA